VEDNALGGQLCRRPTILAGFCLPLKQRFAKLKFQVLVYKKMLIFG